jgi:hypothetical protein
MVVLGLHLNRLLARRFFYRSFFYDRETWRKNEDRYAAGHTQSIFAAITTTVAAALCSVQRPNTFYNASGGTKRGLRSSPVAT